MKKSKKAIFGMLVAMVMSLGLMGGINGKSHDSNLQQLSVISAYAGGSGEDTLGRVICTTISFGAGTVAAGLYKTAFVSAATGVGAVNAVAFGLLGGICSF
jgi:hypothetical protein